MPGELAKTFNTSNHQWMTYRTVENLDLIAKAQQETRFVGLCAWIDGLSIRDLTVVLDS